MTSASDIIRGPRLEDFDYKWDRPGSPYRMPAMHFEHQAPYKVVLGMFNVVCPATGSVGTALRSFGRKTQVGFIPGSGILDGEEVYHIEVEVDGPARRSHHKDGDIQIWMKPVRFCTPDEMDAYELYAHQVQRIDVNATLEAVGA